MQKKKTPTRNVNYISLGEKRKELRCLQTKMRIEKLFKLALLMIK